jgi:hypothetical protein
MYIFFPFLSFFFFRFPLRQCSGLVFSGCILGSEVALRVTSPVASGRRGRGGEGREEKNPKGERAFLLPLVN